MFDKFNSDRVERVKKLIEITLGEKFGDFFDDFFEVSQLDAVKIGEKVGAEIRKEMKKGKLFEEIMGEALVKLYLLTAFIVERTLREEPDLLEKIKNQNSTF